MPNHVCVHYPLNQAEKERSRPYPIRQIPIEKAGEERRENVNAWLAFFKKNVMRTETGRAPSASAEDTKTEVSRSRRLSHQSHHYFVTEQNVAACSELILRLHWVGFLKRFSSERTRGLGSLTSQSSEGSVFEKREQVDLPACSKYISCVSSTVQCMLFFRSHSEKTIKSQRHISVILVHTHLSDLFTSTSTHGKLMSMISATVSPNQQKLRLDKRADLGVSNPQLHQQYESCKPNSRRKVAG